MMQGHRLISCSTVVWDLGGKKQHLYGIAVPLYLPVTNRGKPINEGISTEQPGLTTGTAERAQQLTHVAWLLSHTFRTFLHFQLARQVTHILPCCTPTSAPTLNTGLDIYPTELALFKSDQQLQPLTPWPRLLTAVPHPAAPSVYKRKLVSQSTEKQEMTVQREVLAGSSVLPRDSEAQRQSEQGCVHWPAPCFSNSAAELAAVWGEFSAISSRGSAGRWGEERNKCSWHSSPHNKNNFMTDFVDGEHH